MKKTFCLALSFVFAAACLPFAVFAEQGEIYIGVTGGDKKGAKIMVAIAPFIGERAGNKDDAPAADTFREIIRADLLYSRYFDISENGPVLAGDEATKAELAAWSKTGAQYLITGKAANVPGKLWTLTVHLYDLSGGTNIVSKYYRGQPAALRRGAHLYADLVVKQLTGKDGIAHTRIAFANDSSGNKEIYVTDYDGKGIVRLTRDKSIALLPRWAPDGESIYYTTYRYQNPDTFEIDLKDQKIRPISLYQGVNLPGGVSPDGKDLAITLSRGRTPNIYIMNLESKKLRQLTKGSSVDSSATFSPDNNYVAFVSDRSGNPQIYITELATGEVKRLTRLNWCDSPEWSPTGEWIVFAGREDRNSPMDIYLIDPTGSQLRKLTNNAGSNEDPSWSPDGRFIAFTSTRDNGRQIYVMDADGSAPHLVERLAGKSYTPHWSP
ncbi:MAG: DPP IV N-terminal domain-containing protein [Elusimicrobiaceae bacterium]